ncbi:MAG: tripartite tricarboxylate transporter substrate binding protein [Betaproteobacteria bacterium]|nr:tripartite tricarboxylate transporter substrate binding protein [Betaproteobacteria bacterium]
MLAGSCIAAYAQDVFPSRPIKVIVPVTGGTMDLLARLVAPKLSEALGQPVLVENRPGAGGSIATDFVAKGPADGYTLLIGSTGAIAINVTLQKNLPYDPVRDLAPITNAVMGAQLLVVHKSVPVATVAELVAHAKARAGQMSYGSIGVGTASHLTMEMFKSAAGMNLVHVPYKGAGPAMTDLIGGHLHAGFFVASNALPHIKSGTLKALASTGRKRIVALPGVPTMIESGFQDFEAIAWIGFLARAGTPAPLLDRLHGEIVRILATPEVRDKLVAEEFEVIGSSRDEFGSLIRSEILRWGTVIKQIGAVGSG